MNNLIKSVDLFSQEYNTLFQSAEQYKKSLTLRVVLVEEETKVDTIISHESGESFFETTNTAHNGDAIVESPTGEKYVVSKEEFEKFYTRLDSGLYREERVVKAIKIDKDLTFKTKWGTESLMKGGWIVEAGSERYGVDEESFEKTYKKVANL